MACLQFSLDKASDRVVRIWILFKFVRKLLWDEDNFSNETWENGYKGCLVHSFVLFLMAMERFWSIDFSDWLGLWGRMRNCFISKRWFRSLDLYKCRNCNFLPWVHFANHSILRSRLRLGFREVGYGYWRFGELGYGYGYWIRH